MSESCCGKCCRGLCTKFSYTLMLGLILVPVVLFGLDFCTTTVLVNTKNFDKTRPVFDAPVPSHGAKLQLMITGLTITEGFYNPTSQCFVRDIRSDMRYQYLKTEFSNVKVDLGNGWETKEVLCLDEGLGDLPMNTWYTASLIVTISLAGTIAIAVLLIWLCCVDWCRCCCCPAKTSFATSGHVYV